MMFIKLRKWWRIIASLVVAAQIALVVSIVVFTRFSPELSLSHVVLEVSDAVVNRKPYLQSVINKRNERALTGEAPVHGFIDRHSVFKGETFNLMLAAHSGEKIVTGHVEISRVEYYGEKSQQLQWRSSTTQVPARQLHGSAPTLGVGWPPVFDDVADPLPLLTTLFREKGCRPENMLMGVAWQNWFTSGDESLRYSYTIKDATLPFFHKTGLKVGDQIEGIVGYEWDNTDPVGDGVRLWTNPEEALIDYLPQENLSILFEGSPVSDSEKQCKAEAVYFESSAGAKVFSSGTNRWVWGLGKEGFVNEKFQQLNRNIVLFF